MNVSSGKKEFVSYVIDLMQVFGEVRARRMFGGYGVFLEGLMFGLISENTLYLKTDKDNVQEFIDLGLLAFTYMKKGKEFKISYYQAPEEALEDPEQMTLWAGKAYRSALRAASKKSAKK